MYYNIVSFIHVDNFVWQCYTLFDTLYTTVDIINKQLLTKFMTTQTHSEPIKAPETIPHRYGAENFLARVYEAMTPEQRAEIRATLKANANQ